MTGPKAPETTGLCATLPMLIELWRCLCFCFFLEMGAGYWPLETLTTEIPTGKITLHPQFLPHSDRADMEGLTEILWNGLLGFACP